MGIFIHFINIENQSKGSTHQHMNEFHLANAAIKIDTNHPNLVVISSTLVTVAIKILFIILLCKIMF